MYPTAATNIHMTVDVDNNQQMWFKHRLAAGAFDANAHYGIYLAELAKMPPAIVERAVRWSKALRGHTSVVATEVSCNKTRTQQELLTRLIAMKHVPRTKQQTVEELDSIMADFSELLAESTHHHRREHQPVAAPAVAASSSSVCNAAADDVIKPKAGNDTKHVGSHAQLPPSHFQLLSPATQALPARTHTVHASLSPRSAPAAVSLEFGQAAANGFGIERKYNV